MLIRKVLMAAADDAGGKTGRAKETKEGEEPEADDFDERVGKLLDARLSKALNGAISARFARERDALQTSLAKLLDERLPKPAAEGEDGEAPEVEAKGKAKPEAGPSKSELALAAQVKAMQKKLDDEAKAREAVEAKRMRDEESSLLGAALRKAGITDEDHVRSLQARFREDQVIKRDKDGKVIYVRRDDGFDDEKSLELGVAEWAKSDSGKKYLPATGAHGSGGTGAQRGKETGQPKVLSREESGANLARALLPTLGRG